MKKLILFVVSMALFSTTTRAEDWCAGIRGNGQLAPAHWAAMARLVEELGLPRISSGGSSATISMFFVDAIAGNPSVAKMPSSSKKNQAYGFLIKSLPVFVDTMAREHGLIAAFKMASEVQTNGTRMVEDLKKVAADPKNQALVKQIFGTYWPMLNPKLMVALQAHPEFFQKELMQTLRVFGNFDAKTDDNLFVRHGLVDFKYFAILLGVIADFYSDSAPADVRDELAAITRDCTGAFYRKGWSLADGARLSDTARTSCEARFVTLVKKYVSQDLAKFPHSSVFKAAGHNLSVLPTTSVVIGASAVAYRNLMAEYNAAAAKDYSRYSVDFKNDMWFGYWGKAADLSRVQSGLAVYRSQNDLKSQKMMQLGPASWFEVLSLSPAEPGLANLQEIPVGTSRAQVLAELMRPVDQTTKRWESLKYRSGSYSAGGWSDLHPTLVLKAAGCENVVYVTRQDGDAIFGQQVFIRLVGLQDKVTFWKDIEAGNNQGFNVEGTDAEKTAWNQLYNLGSESSYKRSLREASAIYCTNWNKYETFRGEIWPMIEDTQSSPVILNPGAPAALQVNPINGDPRGEGFPGCVVR